MSRESEIMDQVLSVVASVIPGATTNRGYKAHSDIAVHSLPYAQAFNPITETSHTDWRQNDTVLSFSLEIIEKASSTNADTMRGWLDSINLKVKDDTTLNGLAWDSWISTRGIDERSVRERVLAGMIFNVRSWDEYTITAHNATVVDFSVPTKWTTTNGNTLSVGSLAPNATSITFAGTNSVADVKGGSSTSNPDATWNMSGITTLYAHFFLSDSLYDTLPASGAFTLTLGSTSGNDWSKWDSSKTDLSKGWNRVPITVASPTSSGSGTLPIAAIPEVSISFPSSSSSNIANAATVARIYESIHPNG